MESVIKIFGASEWHNPVLVIGNKQALLKLKDTIQKAIDREDGYSSERFLEADGEGFNIEVKLYDEEYESENSGWNKLPNHYTDEIASTKNKEYWKNLYRLMRPGRLENEIDKLLGNK